MIRDHNYSGAGELLAVGSCCNKRSFQSSIASMVVAPAKAWFSILVFMVLFSQGAFADSGETYNSSKSSPENYQNEIRGILATVNKAVYTTDLDAAVSKVSYREGESFKKGDLLISFDCRRQNAELQSLKAAHREMSVQLEGNVFLERRGAAGKRDLEVSRARAERAAHDARALELRLERCNIMAPFNGRISTLVIHEHETPVSGKPILEILGTNEMELQLIVPSVWLVWLEEGSKFSFKIDETDREYDAKVYRIGAAVDPISQTITLTGQFLSPAPDLRAGMSGTANFSHQGANVANSSASNPIPAASNPIQEASNPIQEE